MIAPTDAFFQMTVEDVFSIRGRGTVVTGRIAAGTVQVGDAIYLHHSGNVITTVVNGIEILRQVVQQAETGDNVGLLLRALERNQVARGDVLLGVP
jgi:translation elongation factor EF-Tu-like GTPase